MKVLFISQYINNGFYIPITKQTMDKNLKNCDWEFICLNDAPELGKENNFVISSGKKVEFLTVLEGKEDCHNEIKENASECNFHHLKIPQNIHPQNRPNHGGGRHIEILNYFFQNIDTLFPRFKEFDYLCTIDSDAFFVEETDLEKELEETDLAGPIIYKNRREFYPHVGLFFINLKTVINFKDMNFNNIWKDTGSNLMKFIEKNKNYKLKEIGKYIGYQNDYCWTPNGKGIKKIGDHIDCWLNSKVYHLRAGSCFGVGSNLRTEESVKIFKNKVKTLFDNFNFSYDKSKF